MSNTVVIKIHEERKYVHSFVMSVYHIVAFTQTIRINFISR